MLSQALLMRCSHRVGLLLFCLEALTLYAVMGLNSAIQDGRPMPVTGLFLLCPALPINNTIALHAPCIALMIHATLSLLMPAVGKRMTRTVPHSD